MIWAWEVDGLTSSTKLVLLSLAQHANEDGQNSFPSVATIAGECRMSERTVQNALKALEAEGYVSVVRRLRQTSLFSLRMDLHVVARRDKGARSKGAADSPYPANAAPSKGANAAPSTPQNLQFKGAAVAPEPVLEPVSNQPDARAGACEADAAPGGAFDALFGSSVAATLVTAALGAAPAPARPTHAPSPTPVRDTPQQPAPPGYTLPHNPSPRHINYPPIPPVPVGDPVRWMPRLSDPEHRWACLAPGEEIDPRSMTGARRQCRGAWILRDIAQQVADAMGWSDPRRYTDWRPLCAWLDDGLDPHETILPTIRRVVERRGNVEISTLAYFDRAVRDAAAGGRRRAG